MIDETLSTRMSLLAIRSEKNAFTASLNALETLPFERAKSLIRQLLEENEDMEISLERKLEPLTPLHSAVL